jgi:DNA helicase IV
LEGFENISLKLDNLNALLAMVNSTKRYSRRLVLYYVLCPLLIGVLLSYRARKRLQDISARKANLVQEARNDIDLNDNVISSLIVGRLNGYPTYLVWAARDNWSSLLREYGVVLNALAESKNELSNQISASNELLTKAQSMIESYNEKFIALRRQRYKSLFQSPWVTLDDEQQVAIVTDEKHNLVTAGAGSGKTEVLVNRIVYLVKREPDTIEPERILALAFQRKASEEIEERLEKRFQISKVKVKTFHALGLEILSAAGKDPKLKFDTDTGYVRFIRSIFDEAKSTPGFLDSIVRYMKSYEPFVRRTEADFETKEEYYGYQNNLSYMTLKGVPVKSDAEKDIMNFFLSRRINGKGVKIDYEKRADWMAYTSQKGRVVVPRPDFYLPEYDLYIEHWAIDEKGNVPAWFGENAKERYKYGMNKKKEAYQSHNKLLVETTSGQYFAPDFLENLQKSVITALEGRYVGQRFSFSDIPYEELVQKVYYELNAHIQDLPRQIANFITIAKTYDLDSNRIRQRLDDKKGKWSKKQIAFADIALRIYEKYTESLRAGGEIDFADMINLAIVELVKNDGLYNDVFDHILVDEFQDLSTQRYKLLKALMNKNARCKLFSVGDDWQSIMGFAGSNLDFILRFENYFDHPATSCISTNYRSLKSIVDLGSKVIKYNGRAQVAKITKAKNPRIEPVELYAVPTDRYDWKEYYGQMVEHCISRVAEHLSSGYDPQDLMILVRIAKNPRLMNLLFEGAKAKGIKVATSRRNPKAVPVMSIHKSKGLQARAVFLLNVIDHTYGLPCTLEDLDVFAPAIEGIPRPRGEEERRLFYVAITRAKERLVVYTQSCRESKFIKEIKGLLSDVGPKKESVRAEVPQPVPLIPPAKTPVFASSPQRGLTRSPQPNARWLARLGSRRKSLAFVTCPSCGRKVDYLRQALTYCPECGTKC